MPYLRPKSMLRRSPSGSVIPPGSQFGVTGRASRTTPGPGPSNESSSNNPVDVPGRSDFRLRPQYQYITVYNAVSEVYRQMYDEALRNDPSNALRMLRSGLIPEQLEKRYDAGRALDWHVDCEDPDDPVQVKYKEKYTKLIELIPRFDQYRYHLKWSQWYGKAGLQQFWGNVKVNGKNAISVTDHIPVNGDSIGYTFDGVPKIQISSMADYPKTSVPPRVVQDDRGMALLLNSRYWRTCFAISTYKPWAPDWLREPEMALAMFGYGLRGRMYWTWWLNEEVRRWHIDALERIGSNGDYVGFYPSGNDPAEQAMLQALKLMQRQHYTAIPFSPGMDPQSAIQAVPPANVAYDVQSKFISYSEGIMKRMICGEDTDDHATEASNDQSETAFGTILKCDAKSEADTLTTDLLHPMIRMNDGSLPFQLKISVRSVAKDVGEQIATAQVLFGMGIDLSKRDLLNRTGFSPPRNESDAVRMPQQPQGGDEAPHDGYGGLPGDSKPAPGPGLAAKGPGLGELMDGDQPRPDTDQSPGNLPVGLEANLSRKMRAAVQNGNALRNTRDIDDELVYESHPLDVGPGTTRAEFEKHAMSQEDSTKAVAKIRAGSKDSKNGGQMAPEVETKRLVHVALPMSAFSKDTLAFLRETTNPDRVDAYRGKKIDTPIYALPLKKSHGFMVSDGGHRLMAAVHRGDKSINAHIPVDSYDKLMENFRPGSTELQNSKNKAKPVVVSFDRFAIQNAREGGNGSRITTTNKQVTKPRKGASVNEWMDWLASRRVN